MGKSGSKMSLGGNNKAEIKKINPEFEYRTENLKRVKTAFKALKKSLGDVMSDMENTPIRLKAVGNGYSNLGACLNHSGGGGAAAREEPEGDGDAPATSPSKMNRELADESYRASQKFCDTMETIRTNTCPKFRGALQEKIANEIDGLIAMTERAIAQGKETGISLQKYSAAVKVVGNKEKQLAKKGTDVNTNTGYLKAVNDRDAKEKTYKADLRTFDTQYEDLMADSQSFAESTTEVFLETTVGYYQEVVMTLDYTETPQRSRTRSRPNRQNNNNNENSNGGEESHEPAPGKQAS